MSYTYFSDREREPWPRLGEEIPEPEIPRIGWFCTYTPEEVIIAAGLHPERVTGSTEPVREADAYLHDNLCPFVRSCLDVALRGHYDHLDGVVFVNSCDAMRRLHEAWKRYIDPPFVHVLNVPRIETEAAVGYYRTEIQRLKCHLEEHFSVEITQEALADAIRLCNRTRHLLKQLYDRRVEDEPGLNGLEALTTLNGAMNLPKDVFNARLEEFLKGLSPKATGDTTTRYRFLIAGGILDHPGVVQAIEEAGGVVVADDLCTGSRYFEGLVEETADPLESLAKRYLCRMPCARMRNTERRVENLLRLVGQYRIDGVIYYAIKFCDAHLFDYVTFREALDAHDIPILRWESDHTEGSVGQLKTRIEAFIEMM